MPDHNNNLHHHASPSTYEIARILRKQQTEAEELLWQLLRNRKIAGLKFRRQHPFENYVLDFYCHEWLLRQMVVFIVNPMLCSMTMPGQQD
jgi:very-short-patch-repair endonuclease